MSAPSTRRPGISRLLPILVIVSAAMLRAAALGVGSSHLSEDRDDYLVVAQQYANVGFWTPFKGIPNSFRPPLYPLVIAAILKAGGGNAALGLLQLVLGTATVALTWQMGRQLGLASWSLVAAILVALDPLLIDYTTFPMTETLFTFLVALLVKVAAPAASEKASRRRPLLKAAAVGVIFGGCALCRPTIWPVAGLAAVWLCVRSRRAGESVKQLMFAGSIAAVGVATVVAPWALRNWQILGSPVFTTTHGGYTLLLGNNREFFRQVADRPLLEEWRDSAPDRFQRAWFQDLVSEMDRQIGPAAGEIAQDRWMYRRAWQDIAAEPRLFLRACLLRFAEFWNVVPLTPSRSEFVSVAVWGAGTGYLIELVLFVVGIVGLSRRWESPWVFPLLLILNFTLVHLFYWSNMRMRAPLVPLIALVASRGIAEIYSLVMRRSQTSLADAAKGRH
jgi:hypothetical protein